MAIHKNVMTAAVMLALLLVLPAGCAARKVVGNPNLRSPDGKLQAKVYVNDSGRLCYTLSRSGQTILEESPLGIISDGVDLGQNVRLAPVRSYSLSETYPYRGKKSTAADSCQGREYTVTHPADDTTWTLDFRLYNDGAAFRYIVPASGIHTVTGEATGWRLPAESKIWYQTNTGNYENIHTRARPAEVEEGTTMGFPITVELPQEGYAAITEAALFDYSGITARATGTPLLQAVFEDDPDGFTLEGEIKSPWRVTMVGADLNSLVNCTIVGHLAGAPDENLFERGLATEWVRPGRAVWHWWSAASVDLQTQKQWTDKAQQLGFEYILVDEGWSRWKDGDRDKWDLMKELVDYAGRRNVGVWAWKAAPDRNNVPGIYDQETRREFLDNCREVGLVGVKIDFMDSEAKRVIDFYEETLREAAQRKIMVNFHGANKPTGEWRRYPNEMTREGVRGLEYNKWSELGPHHYASLPFTRYLAGHGDFTPCTLNPAYLKGTTVVLQLATAIVYTSPVIHWADKPDLYLQSKALDVIKTIPPVWDKTLVLPNSEIGELAAFARRKGDDWFVGIINGGDEKQYRLDLSFLNDGEYEALLVRDLPGQPAEMETQKVSAGPDDKIDIRMSAGGGFVARLSKK